MPAWRIRPYRDDDAEQVRAVNAANVPEVGVLDDERLTLFCAEAAFFDVVEVGGAVLGVFVALAEGTTYRSPNYRWFAERHERFAYVDRIALQPELRGTGAAHALYAGFEDWARSQGREVACAEVNVVPPNPRSMRFHQRRGFVVVEEVAPYGDDERVAMVEKSL